MALDMGLRDAKGIGLRCALAILVLATGAPCVRAGTLFWTISGDPNNSYVPDVLSSGDTSTQTVAAVGPIGGGSLAFNGGLTAGPGGTLYGIGNDSTVTGSFFSIQPDGTLTLIGAAGGLGSGFLGGLAYDSQNSTFYAAVLDPLGNTTLDSISPGGIAAATGMSLGTGFSGLAFDEANGLFYGIANDNTGLSTLVEFSLGGGVNSIGSLGYGFGALSYDRANDVFWAIAPVNNAGSALFQVTAAGAASSQFTLGDGFAELAVQPQAVPEPGAGTQLAGGLSLLILLMGRIRPQARSAK